MGQVCEMFDLPASTIRFWEKNFAELKPRKNAKGNRLFTNEDVETLKLIYHLLKDKGMTLSGAQKYLKDRRSSMRQEVGVVETLQRIRATLLDIRADLDAREKQQAHEILIQSEQAIHQIEQPELSAEDEDQTDQKPRYIELSLFD